MDEDEVYFSYAKNGDDLGICFQIEKSQLNGQALFPHVLTKNVSFEVNFGAQVSIRYMYTKLYNILYSCYIL